MEKFKVLIDWEVYVLLEALAEGYGMSVDEVVNQIVRDFLDRLLHDRIEPTIM